MAVRSLQNVLDGTTGGKIKVATERLGLVSGITAFASAPAIAYKGNPEAPAFASDVASFLSTFYKHAPSLLFVLFEARYNLEGSSGTCFTPLLHP